VKGKRSCPARGGSLICSRCCGANRVTSIHCPSDCIYLHGAHDPKWSSESQEKESARFFARMVDLGEGPAEFCILLHYLLAMAKNPLWGLDDGELREALVSAASTLETRLKGILYSHPTERSYLQPAADWLVRLIGSRRELSEAPPISDAESVAVLRTLAASVEEHVRNDGRERYLSKAERLLSKAGVEAPPLALPGDLEEPPPRLIVTP
jgi:hypothetical protein